MLHNPLKPLTGLLRQYKAKMFHVCIHALIISGTLNFALVATFITLVLKERRGSMISPSMHHHSLKQILLRNEEVLSQYFCMSFKELIKELYDETLVEHGYRHCDLALSCLTEFHYFDLERALPGEELEKCECCFSNPQGGEEVLLTLYPGMEERHFQAIRAFVHVEIWPLTSFGLYQELCRCAVCPLSLRDALMMTSEIYVLKRQLFRLTPDITDDMIVDLLRYCEWADIERFASLPPFLLSCMQKDSKLAAYLLVLLGEHDVLCYLDNEQMKKLLSLLTEKTPEVEAFLTKISEGIRPENVKKLARRSCEATKRTYLVQQGDNLWKISRKCNVTVEELREHNGLISDILKPGTLLVLPPKSGEN